MKKLIALLLELLMSLALMAPALADAADDAVASDLVEEFDPANDDVPYEYTVDQASTWSEGIIGAELRDEPEDDTAEETAAAGE